MDGGLSGNALLGMRVCFRDIRLGVVSDVLLDGAARRALGLLVLCGDRATRFLPWPAADVDGGASMQLSSPLVLMTRELDFYRPGARELRALHGADVSSGRRRLGVLADVRLRGDGVVDALVLDDGGAELTLPPHAGLVFGAGALRPAV